MCPLKISIWKNSPIFAYGYLRCLSEKIALFSHMALKEDHLRKFIFAYGPLKELYVKMWSIFTYANTHSPLIIY